MRAFCDLYRQVSNVKGDDERLALAERVRSSDLGANERSWLLFSLITPGMRISAAKRISGGKGAKEHVSYSSRSVPLTLESTAQARVRVVDEVYAHLYLRLDARGDEHSHTETVPEPRLQ